MRVRDYDSDVVSAVLRACGFGVFAQKATVDLRSRSYLCWLRVTVCSFKFGSDAAPVTPPLQAEIALAIVTAIIHMQENTTSTISKSTRANP